MATAKTSSESIKQTASEKKSSAGASAASGNAKKGYDAMSEWFSVPNFDAKGVFEFQRRNIEAAIEANKIVFDGLKAATQKNIDLAKDSIAELNEVAGTAVSAKTPETSLQDSFELTKKMYQKNLAVAREAGDLVVDAGQKAVALLQKRYTDGAEELNNTSK